MWRGRKPLGCCWGRWVTGGDRASALNNLASQSDPREEEEEEEEEDTRKWCRGDSCLDKHFFSSGRRWANRESMG
ncbi:hypothetical protein AALO_G00006330 [Alosa alosa]|uniref:Uncharacterized protein n=1 Tax=Alosa alosa TaxID=278164 RepID=A0AAV6HEH7_9TELE|nr:hypothetical protein AALO_G00006330 [Alosa alosa]